MTEYLIQGETLTKIADEVRELSGSTENMSPNIMIETLKTENENLASALATQDDLISQIQTALAGKAAGSGGYEIGTFTISGVKQGIVSGSDLNSQKIFPFIIGQTWQEWINSSLNQNYFYDAVGFQCLFIIDSTFPSCYLSSGFTAYISTDSTSSGCVTLNDQIQNGIEYGTYLTNNPYE